MASFDNLIHMQKTLECAQQHFGTQISLLNQDYFDPTVR
jgi:hypothetical protein